MDKYTYIHIYFFHFQKNCFSSDSSAASREESVMSKTPDLGIRGPEEVKKNSFPTKAISPCIMYSMFIVLPAEQSKKYILTPT